MTAKMIVEAVLSTADIARIKRALKLHKKSCVEIAEEPSFKGQPAADALIREANATQHLLERLPPE